MQTPPTTLVIAGSDSGGGAGIQADLKALTRCGVHGCTAVTALTAQNSRGVQGIDPVEGDFVRRQIESVVEDFDVAVTKTGMLFNEDVIETVIATRDRLATLVVDPVMVAESGDALLEPAARERLIHGLLPLADLVTPNLPEAEVIREVLGLSEASDDAELATEIALRLDGPRVLLKGGHRDRDDAVDLLANAQGEVRRYESERVETENTHGSGCAFASLIAGNLALGESLPRAVAVAKDAITRALRTSYRPGSGPGTPNLLEGFDEAEAD